MTTGEIESLHFERERALHSRRHLVDLFAVRSVLSTAAAVVDPVLGGGA